MSNADESKLEFPPFSPDEEESWDDYKKKVRNKFGNKYDAALNLGEAGKAFGDFMEGKNIEFLKLPPEEQEKVLIKLSNQKMLNQKQTSQLRKIIAEIGEEIDAIIQERYKDSNDY